MDCPHGIEKSLEKRKKKENTRALVFALWNNNQVSPIVFLKKKKKKKKITPIIFNEQISYQLAFVMTKSILEQDHTGNAAK